MPAKSRFVLCADDYAMTPAVSGGILRLLEAGRISATGAMTNLSHWPQAAPALAPFVGRADIGLHFNLTCGAPLTPMRRLAPGGEMPRLTTLLKAGMAACLPVAEVVAELEAQLEAFEQAMGRVPDFIDGHQHVHAMPGVRRALRIVLPGRYPRGKPYLRAAADSPARILARGAQPGKALLVAGLTASFGATFRALGFATNAGFAGYSAFDSRSDYAASFAGYLSAPGPRHLVMCHPGGVDDALFRLDPVRETRPQERDFFLSPRFDEICAAAAMRHVRFMEL